MPKDVWAIRVRLQIENRTRDLAMFNLAIDNKLWGCDLVSQRIEDISIAGRVKDRETIIQRKTARLVQFEITEPTRASLLDRLAVRLTDHGTSVFPSRVRNQLHLTARRYARIVHSWIKRAEMDSCAYGTHPLRRTKAAIIYKQTGNLGAVQPRGQKSHWGPRGRTRWRIWVSWGNCPGAVESSKCFVP